MVNGMAAGGWPFSRPELMAGLRRYLAAGSLRLLGIAPMPLPSTMPGVSYIESGAKLSGMSVDVLIDGEQFNLPLVLKEPPVSNGRVLRAVGQREYGVYRRLAPHLPLLVPGLVAGDEEAGWVVLEVLTGLRPATEWTAEDYEEAIVNLVAMHDRFWGLAADLTIYPWLARVLDADYDLTVQAAREAAQALTTGARLPQLADAHHARLFTCLTDAADAVVAPLRAEPATLIHGDYWPGNIARPLDGRQIVFDWQMAGIGPAILDLVGFVQASHMRLRPPLSAAAMIDLYRRRCDALVEPGWDDARFALLWDHALMWLFMVNWLGRLATMPPENYAALHESFSRVWLDALAAAVARRL
jgi:hypothetical protein